MQVSFWFSVEEKLPNKSGLYFACILSFPRDHYTKPVPGFYWWDSDRGIWFSEDKKIPELNVQYWTFADPCIWYEFDYPTPIELMNSAQLAALQEVYDATERYNLISKLTKS